MRVNRLLEGGVQVVKFGEDGGVALCGGSDGTFAGIDVHSGGVSYVKKVKRKSGADVAITALAVPQQEQKLVLVGEDEGMVRLWDARVGQYALKRHEHRDYVSAIRESPTTASTVYTASADGTLGVWDLRTSSSGGVDPKFKFKGASFEVQDELLAMALIKGGRKIVCGSAEGVLNIYSANSWSDVSDRFLGHPHSIDAIVEVDNDTVLTGSSDGLIRAVQLHPNKLLGLVGEHGELPIERLTLSKDCRLLASCSHDEVIQFYDVAALFHDDQDDGNSDGDGEGEGEGEAGEGPDQAESAGGAQVQSGKRIARSGAVLNHTNRDAGRSSKKQKKRRRTDRQDPNFFDDL
mmetsp:Transcript_2278/g.6814  ORF Transcript_2278/g.6814 Transcript_2278/m.6814 type:complete len:349 (+) Transcript_2278:2384-3430(+)